MHSDLFTSKISAELLCSRESPPFPEKRIQQWQLLYLTLCGQLCLYRLQMWSSLLPCWGADTTSSEMFQAEFFWVSFLKGLVSSLRDVSIKHCCSTDLKGFAGGCRRANFITRRQWVSLGPLNGIYAQTEGVIHQHSFLTHLKNQKNHHQRN